MFTEKELLEDPVLRIFVDDPLPEKNAEEIADLLFPNDNRMIDAPVYVRYKSPKRGYGENYEFKLIQPIEVQVIIAANSLAGGKWESRELHGPVYVQKDDAIEFINSYIGEYITRNEDKKVEVNMFAYDVEYKKRLIWISDSYEDKNEDDDIINSEEFWKKLEEEGF